MVSSNVNSQEFSGTISADAGVDISSTSLGTTTWDSNAVGNPLYAEKTGGESNVEGDGA